MNEQERARRVSRGREQAERLAARDVVAVALTFVDTSGITRVKGVPIAAFNRVSGWGVGATPVFDAFGMAWAPADRWTQLITQLAP